MKSQRVKSMLSAAVVIGTMASAHAEDVEVLHWWTSGGEAAALNVLKDDLAGQGIGWQDMPVAGGGGGNAMTVLRARVTSGTPPTAVQMLGFDIQDWAAEEVVANLNGVADAEGWNAVVPDALQQFSTYDGKWVSAPVNVHSTNWIWANKKLLKEVGAKQPETWEELIVTLDKLKAAGYIPLAHGGQPWQDATIFDSVVLTTGGIDFYKKAMIDLDPEALGSDTMVKIFDRMSQLRDYVDKNFPGRDWNLASALVIEDKAGMQIMGDWAKGEFLKAGKVPNEDFACFRMPGTQGMVTFNADQFVMFDVGDSKAQQAMAKAIMSPEFQSAFNVVKGSVPARTDVSNEAFDACGKKGMADLAEANKNGTLVGSMAHGHAAPAAVKNAVYDVVTNHFNGGMNSKQATKALVSAVQDAQ
ncbi:ABC transporter substrate-binding protein [Enterovibrio nigricans]|uniref:Probable sugar-binding periplasmic protein n=1 Tax=Enterovibrio nigricans DSM 22720 TaxID=1121868 RepID=A0A1T4TZK9_9GAMM|nr:ABC transporter substrate-binding protein [Enterovibrio nigricans]PKF51692.1 carbohydrate ABC transporter substrate-binding protein [Enterovibrio nigricans]SKA45874.1 glucose/mannose transport system substrate-binding protein [Enterovibrio nigricans DSM 22720]